MDNRQQRQPEIVGEWMAADTLEFARTAEPGKIAIRAETGEFLGVVRAEEAVRKIQELVSA